jgi:hypothetical protein
MISSNHDSVCAVRFSLLSFSPYVTIIGLCVMIPPSTSSATIVITGDLTVVENRPVDDFFGFPGLHLLTRVDATHSSGSAALTNPPAGATVTSNNGDFPFANPSTLPMVTPIGSSGASFSQR